jgi:hypothetical protein
MKYRAIALWFFAGVGIAVVAAAVGFAVAAARRRTDEMVEDAEPSLPMAEPEPVMVP